MKKVEQAKRRLKLARQTVRELAPAELKKVDGGMAPTKCGWTCIVMSEDGGGSEV